MVWQPGQSGFPSGNNGHSTRRKGTREAFQKIQEAGYIDPLVNLAKIQHESENEGIRASAAASLLGYCHPKLQSIPVPRYIELAPLLHLHLQLSRVKVWPPRFNRIVS
jgi:hypothetical protein